MRPYGPAGRHDIRVPLSEMREANCLSGCMNDVERISFCLDVFQAKKRSKLVQWNKSARSSLSVRRGSVRVTGQAIPQQPKPEHRFYFFQSLGRLGCLLASRTTLVRKNLVQSAKCTGFAAKGQDFLKLSSAAEVSVRS